MVTTSHKARPSTRRHAEEFAKDAALPYCDRDDRPIEDLLTEYSAALIVTNDDKQVATADGILKAHLGTAFIRLMSISRNESDPMLRVSELQPGDDVIDTTFGLGRDALVASCAVGTTGSVTALESSLALFHLGRHGLSGGALAPHALTNQFGLTPTTIALEHADARSWLAEAAENSADVVLVDPMFNKPKTSDNGFDLLRSLASPTALDQQWVEEARRVARRWVVVKCGPSEPWFADVGLEPISSHSNANWWRTPGTYSGNVS